MESMVERRLLINYRIAPEVVAPLLPAGLRPQTVNGSAVGGICAIRLGSLRPRGLPAGLGLTSEGCAHRFAVEWGADQTRQRGVFIARRESSSLVNDGSDASGLGGLGRGLTAPAQLDLSGGGYGPVPR